MPGVNTSLVSIMDLYSRSNPNGDLQPIIEQFMQETPILQHAMFVPGNAPQSHIINRRTRLPDASFVKFNLGVKSTKSTVEKVEEAAGVIETLSEIEERVAEVNGKDQVEAYRNSEDASHRQAVRNRAEASFFYSSAAEEPLGLAPRFNSLTGPWSRQICPPPWAQAGADQSSMWMVNWGAQGVYGFVPRGAPPGGYEEIERGKQHVRNAAGESMYVYQRTFRFHLGWAVANPEAVVRCQVDLSAAQITGDLLIKKVSDMKYRLAAPLINHPGTKLYVSKAVHGIFAQQALDTAKAGGQVGYQEIEKGYRQLMILGIPIFLCETLVDTESPIV